MNIAMHVQETAAESKEKKIEKDVRDAGAKIIRFKGATYYAIALSVTRICEAILKNQKSILTVGSVINGPYGIHDVALSLPSVIDGEGIHKILMFLLKKMKKKHYWHLPLKSEKQLMKY